MNKRIHFDRFAGSKLPDNAVLICRPYKWGNPFKISEYGREESLRRYKIFLEEEIKNKNLDPLELKGKDLACNCRLNEPCHGDILLDIVLKLPGNDESETIPGILFPEADE